MKQFSTLTILCFIFSVSMTTAQQGRKIDFTQSQSRTFSKTQASEVQFRMEMDTLFPPSFSEECGGSLIDFTIEGSWGRVSGMNEFLDLEKAQRFSYQGAPTYTVNEVGAWFSWASVIGDGEIKVNIYDVSNTGAPGSLLGSSDPLKVSDLLIAGDEDPLIPTFFSFSDPPVVMDDGFFVSVDFTELYTSQDSVAIYNTVEDCGDGTSSWELFGDGTTWSNYIDSWDLNADLAVLAIVEKQEDVTLEPIDTAFTSSFLDTCGLFVNFFGVTNGWGYVSGTNNFGDLEKAQRFDYPGANNYSATEVAVFFHDAIVVGDGDLSVKLYDVNSDGSPGNVLGTSNSLKVSDLVIPDENNVLPTFFTFEEPVQLEGSQFFASVDLSNLYATQDTVGIFNTNEDCGDGSSTWELFGDGTTWFPFSSEGSWGIDVDLFIFVVLELSVTDVNNVSPEEVGLHLRDAFPNPAGNQITLDFSLDQREDIHVSIYHANGQLVKNHYLGSRMQGSHREVLSLKDLNSGVYFYSIATTKTRVLKKFIVQK